MNYITTILNNISDYNKSHNVSLLQNICDTLKNNKHKLSFDEFSTFHNIFDYSLLECPDLFKYLILHTKDYDLYTFQHKSLLNQMLTHNFSIDDKKEMLNHMLNHDKNHLNNIIQFTGTHPLFITTFQLSKDKEYIELSKLIIKNMKDIPYDTNHPFINDSDIKQKVDYIHSSSHYNKKFFFDYIKNNRNDENNFFDNVLPLFFKMEFDPNIYFNNKDATFSLSRLIHSNNYNFNNIKQFLSIMPEFKESDKDRAFYLNAIFDKIDNKNDFFNLNLDKIHYKILTPIDFVLQHFTFCHNKKNGYNIINNCMDIIIDLFQNKKFTGSQITYDYTFIHYPTNNLQPKTEIKINEKSVKTVYQSFIDNINNLNLYYYSEEKKRTFLINLKSCYLVL